MQTHVESPRATIAVSSTAFGANAPIPSEHARRGGNLPPPVAWSRVPDGTKSVAMLVEDPDAPNPAAPQRTFAHWIVVGIPPSVTSLPAGGALPAGAAPGKNDFGHLGYDGPQPPIGRHRYFFKVYALDANLLSAGVNRTEFLAAIKGHVLAEGELIGTYDAK